MDLRLIAISVSPTPTVSLFSNVLTFATYNVSSPSIVLSMLSPPSTVLRGVNPFLRGNGVVSSIPLLPRTMGKKQIGSLCSSVRQWHSRTASGLQTSQNDLKDFSLSGVSPVSLQAFGISHTHHRLSPSNIILQTKSYSTHRMKSTSRSPQNLINYPSSKKSLSSHTHTAIYPSTIDSSISEDSSTSTNMPLPPLSILPFSSIIRGIVISTISSSPLLLPPSLKIMSVLAHSHSPLLNPDRNPVLKWFLKHTFYAQFCAGENAAEVSRTVNGLKEMGCKGVMLCYAKEAEAEETDGGVESTTDVEELEISPWKKGTLATVAMTEPGDFVALKFTGAGSHVLQTLAKGILPSPPMDAAITEICDLAASRNVRLLFDAEHAALQPGVDLWTVAYMPAYNRTSAIIYSTYQAYLKCCPSVLSAHLALAQKENVVLGVKLVRGAYLASDPRVLICDTKEQTDEQYDGIAEAVMRRRYNSTLRPAAGENGDQFPRVAMVLAGHNLDSARRAMAIRNGQAVNREEMIEMEYAQLQGMADDVSCELVLAAKAVEAEKKASYLDAPKVYKYLVWGTTGECMKYLLRRAQENKDAVGRTREGRDAMAGELVRRIKDAFGYRL